MPNRGWVYLPRVSFQRLIDALRMAGYRCLAPMVRDHALVFDHLERADQLPIGVSDQQGPGSYRLTKTDSSRAFAWANGPQALKPLTFAPQERLWHVCVEQGTPKFQPVQPEVEPTAVIGVRACDLVALKLQKAHFLESLSPDPAYKARVDSLFIVAVDCSHPADTCFCASTGDGPSAEEGYDLAMAELEEGYVLRVGSAKGGHILHTLGLVPATKEQLQSLEQQEQEAISKQSRKLPSNDLREDIYQHQDSPHWETIAKQCLACGNCTAVCPSCFCSSYQAQPALDGQSSDQIREWDSCFSYGHSELHGHPVREDIRTRYRQWLTHKFAGWHEQYGRSGCSGCGRCITWCPVGIDITQVLAELVKEEVA